MAEEQIQLEAEEAAEPEEVDTAEGLAEEDERVVELEAEIARLQDQLAQREEQLKCAVDRCRTLILSGAPEIPDDLIKGETLEEVDASFAAARDMVGRVRRQLEAQGQSERVPIGAPARTPPDLSGLSPGEKIAYALTRQG